MGIPAQRITATQTWVMRAVEPFDGLKVTVKEGAGIPGDPVREVIYRYERGEIGYLLLGRDDPCDGRLSVTREKEDA